MQSIQRGFWRRAIPYFLERWARSRLQRPIAELLPRLGIASTAASPREVSEAALAHEIRPNLADKAGLPALGPGFGLCYAYAHHVPEKAAIGRSLFGVCLMDAHAPSTVIRESSVTPNPARAQLPPVQFPSRATVERLMPLTDIARTFGLLFGIGASLTLFLWAVTFADLVSYAQANKLPIQDRKVLLAGMLGGGIVSSAIGVLFLLRAQSQASSRLSRMALRLAPLVLIGFLPFLFNWQIWVSHELTFALGASVFCFALYATLTASLKASLNAPPRPLLEALKQFRADMLERTRGWAPLLIVVLAAAGYAYYFSYYTILSHQSLRTSSFDLGLEENILWNLVHGGGFMKSSPLSGPTGSHFGYHATLFAYVIVPFYALWQRPETLLIFQAVMLGAAAIPLFAFARRRIGAWPACVIALAFLMYPALHGSNLYDFHYLPLGLFFLWSSLFLFDSERYKLAIPVVLLTLSVREDVAAGLVIIGAFLMFTGRRPRAGAVLSIIAAVYFVGMKWGVMPQFTHGADSFVWQWAGLVPEGGQGHGSVMMTVLGNPAFTLETLAEKDKLLYFLQIGAPLGFLVWRKPLGFLLSLPGFFFTLLTTRYPPHIQISFQYTTHWTAFLFPAVVATLAWQQLPRFPGDPFGWIRKRAGLLTIAAMTLIMSYQFGAVLQQNTARGGFGPFKFGRGDADKAKYDKLHALAAQIPPRAKVVSTEHVVPQIANRPDSYTLRLGTYDAEYLLVETPARDDERRHARALLDSTFGVVKVDLPFILAKRGHPKDLNAEALKHLR